MVSSRQGVNRHVVLIIDVLTGTPSRLEAKEGQEQF